jgi:hypothetical protein
MRAAPAGVDQQAVDSVRHRVQDGPDNRQRPEPAPVVLLGKPQLEGDPHGCTVHCQSKTKLVCAASTRASP